MMKLRSALSGDWVDFRTLVPLVEADVVIAGTVLRIANSALYGCGSITSIARAMTMLGLARLRNLILGISLNQVCCRLQTPPGWPARRFHQHALSTAVLCETLAARVPVSGIEAAFTAGLFHDFGKLLIATALPDQFSQIRGLQGEGRLSDEECEIEVLDATHAEISAEALKRSGMPQFVITAARYHHRPEDDPTPADPERPVLLSELLFTADRLSAELGYGLFPPEPSAVCRPPAPPQVGGRTYEHDEVVSEFQGLFANLTNAMGVQ